MPKKLAWISWLVIALLLIAKPHVAAEEGAVNLEEHENTVFSQSGEDGVIEKIFEIIEPTEKFAVEFGAGDGILGSNVRNLFLHQGWSGLQIEGDPKGFKKLQKNYRDMPRVKNVLAWVWPGNIEFLFEQNGVPENFDFLVIDIDSNDYWVWKVMHVFRPKVVQIEFNPAFAPPQLAVIEYHPMNYPDFTDYHGASIQSLYELGKRKGYELIYCTKSGINLFFVDRIYFDRFGIEDNSPSKLYRPPAFGIKAGGRAPNGRGFPPAEARGPLEYRAGKIEKRFLEH